MGALLRDVALSSKRAGRSWTTSCGCGCVHHLAENMVSEGIDMGTGGRGNTNADCVGR